jgi:hypothetical protein
LYLRRTSRLIGRKFDLIGININSFLISIL